MTMSSLLKQPSSLRLNSLKSAAVTWKETSGQIGKPYPIQSDTSQLEGIQSHSF